VKSNTWVIIPAHNESHYLKRVLTKVLKYWQQVIVVDDGSVDATVRIAKQFPIHLLEHSINLGKGAALKTGCEYAFSKLKASSVVFFDADDQHDSKYLGQMFDALENSPVVFGVRAFSNEMPLARIILNRIASIIVLFTFGQYIPDIPSGFKGLSKVAYKRINWKSSDYLVEMEIATRVAQHKLHFSVVNIPTIYHDLDRGMTVLDILHMLYQMMLWRINK